MKQFLIVSLILFSLVSCSHRIVRTGYQNLNDTLCDIPILKSLPSNDSISSIGEIKLGESGFSVNCNEADAILILKKEACSIHADFIFITQEKRPDAWSTCYRCNAVFYKYKDGFNKPVIHYNNDSNAIRDRVNKDKNTNMITLFVSLVIGYALGLMLFH